MAAHGKWICTLNNNGTHVIKTIYNGKSSRFETAGSSCIFTPPANVKNFTVKAAGGGGGGAGGTAGSKESFYDSRIDGMNFAKSIKHTGTYNVTYVGGGGGGGGMSCGEAKNYTVPNLAADGSFDKSHKGYLGSNDWTWDENSQTHTNSKADEVNYKSPYDGKNYLYGYVDQAVSGFPYKLLTKNDERYTDTKDTSKYALTSPTTGADISTKETAYDFKYHYLSNQAGLKATGLCFSENNWPLSKEINGVKGIYLKDAELGKDNLKCWNLPGEGGMNASPQSSSVFLNAGQSIYVSAGRAGKSQTGENSKNVGLYMPDASLNLTLKNSNVDDGLSGTNGQDTVIDYGVGTKTSAGGRGGYARVISALTYVNIPVMECAIAKDSRGGSFDDNKTDRICQDIDDISSAAACTNNPGCYTYWQTRFYSCSCAGKNEWTCKNYTTNEVQEDGTSLPVEHVCTATYKDYLRCTTGSHSGPIYSVDQGSCRRVMRATYFAGKVNACLYDGAPSIDERNANFLDVDFPHLNSPIHEVKTKGDEIEFANLFGKHKYAGEPGSGGYGVGETIKNYIMFLSNMAEAVLTGEDGEDGGASVTRTTYMGGSGGQAGYYMSTMFKKLDKLEVIVGRGGAPSPGDSHSDAFRGGMTIIKKHQGGAKIVSLSGGMPGQANKLSLSSFSAVSGGDGAPSPMESLSNQAKIIPFGGMSGSNPNMSGYSAKTEIWTNPTASALGVAGLVRLYFTGGHPLDVTYGAGGGGGAGSVSSAGNGGAGAPGVVIVEW